MFVHATRTWNAVKCALIGMHCQMHAAIEEHLSTERVHILLHPSRCSIAQNKSLSSFTLATIVVIVVDLVKLQRNANQSETIAHVSVLGKTCTRNNAGRRISGMYAQSDLLNFNCQRVPVPVYVYAASGGWNFKFSPAFRVHFRCSSNKSPCFQTKSVSWCSDERRYGAL